MVLSAKYKNSTRNASTKILFPAVSRLFFFTIKLRIKTIELAM
jgi:hypothetical protein